jgi:hypothetical protein
MPNDTSNKDDNDGFWDIAFMSQEYEGLERHSDDDGDAEKYPLGSATGKTTVYRFPNTSIGLHLAELPAEDGIMSPVGAIAWYASALLTSLVLQDVANDSVDSQKRSKFFHSDKTEQTTFRVLELGSGAKGLCGFAAATVLSMSNEKFPSWVVTMTDNDKDCLEQLKSNVQANRSKIISEDDQVNKKMNVEYLDWGDDFNDPSNGRLLHANVVIGSELVYTTETARALVNILSHLLANNENIDIWIVQVTDRSGWQEIVLPAIEASPDVKLEVIPLTWDIHEMACGMIPLGGALDRHAFGAYHFSKAQ